MKLAGRAAKTFLGSTKHGRDLSSGIDLLARLADPAALSAFSRTVRSVVDGRGQFVTMLDRSYLMPFGAEFPIVWGEDGIVIPVSHARIAHRGDAATRDWKCWKAPDACRSATTPTASSTSSSGSSNSDATAPNTTTTAMGSLMRTGGAQDTTTAETALGA